jgi:hypothetical protein
MRTATRRTGVDDHTKSPPIPEASIRPLLDHLACLLAEEYGRLVRTRLADETEAKERR